VTSRSTGSTRHWWVLSVTTLGTLLVFTNTTSVNVALPALSADLGVDAATADWFLLSWMLATTASILVFGRISDVAGRRRTYLLGVGVVLGAGLACSLAPNAGVLIALRIVQGFGCAAVISNTHPLVADAFPVRLLPVGLSLVVSTASIGAAIGPVVGGLAVQVWDWRAVFLLNLPFGVAALVLGAKVLRDPVRRPGPRERFDVAGAVLSTLFLTTLLLGINRSAWLLLPAAVLLVVFVLLERRLEHPLIDVRLLTDRSRRLAYGAAFFVAIPSAALVATVSLHEQLLAGRPALQAGASVLPLPLAQMVASPIAGNLARRFSARTLSTTGAVLQVLGIALVALHVSGGTRSPALLVTALVLVGCGNGLFIAPNTASIIGGVTPDRRGIANAVRSVMFNSAQAIGTAVVLLVLAAALTGAGADGYAGGLDAAGTATAERGFLLAAVLMACAPATGAVLSLVRGGPWRLPPPDPPLETSRKVADEPAVRPTLVDHPHPRPTRAPGALRDRRVLPRPGGAG
jgi:EmrB/QacA subfamily drug resistance transporter